MQSCKFIDNKSVLKTSLLIVIFVLFPFNHSNAEITPRITSPHSDWYDLKSKHFHILHDKKDLLIAQRSLQIAEATFQKLSQYFKYSPKDIITISLVNTLDISNGLASIAPTNTIFIITTPPTSDTLLNRSDWYEGVIIHELVHIFHLNQTTGIQKILNKVFGKNYLTTPQVWQPTWIIEGLATYLETSFLKDTRTASNSYENLMANEVSKGIRSFASINAGSSHWPYNTDYLYGSYFFLFLEESYGPDSVKKIIENYGSNLIPFRIVSNTIPVTGKPLTQLWTEFQGWLEQRFSTTHIVKSIAQSNDIKYYNKVSSTAYHVNSPVFSNGNLYTINSDGLKHARIIEQQINGKKRTLKKIGSASLLDAHQQSGILLSQLSFCSSSQLFSDLYVLTPKTNQLQRISQCARYYKAAWSADGKQIAAFKNKGTYTSVELLNKQGKHLRTLTSGKTGDGLSWLSLDWSHDNKRLLILRKIGSNFSIQEFNLATQQWTTLKTDPVIKTSAQYSSNDHAIIYSAEASSTSTKEQNFEIFKLDLATKKETQLSHYQGIAQQPAFDEKSQSLFFVGISPTGPALYSMSAEQQQKVSALSTDPSSMKNTKLSSKPKLIGIDLSKKTVKSTLKPYQPLLTMAPTSRLPTYLNTGAHKELGIRLSGQDTLSTHQWIAGLAYAPDLKIVTHNFSYLYDNWIELSSTRSIDEFNYKNKAHTQLNKYRINTINKIRAQHIFSQPLAQFKVGLSVANLDKQILEKQNNQESKKIKTTGHGVVGVDFTYNSARFFNKKLGLNDGRNLRFSIESYDVFNKNKNLTGNVYQLLWNEYIALGKTTLAFKTQLALSQGGDKPDTLKLGGSSATLASINNNNVAFNRRSFRLRGYPYNAYSGTKLHASTITWQIPLFTINKTASVPPIGLGKIGLNLFAETGKVWESGKTSNYKSSVGAELRGELKLGYLFNIPVNIGVAKGLDKKDGKVQAYVDFSASF